MDQSKKWLTITEIAAEYDISRPTIWRLVKSQKVASERIGHQYRIRREDWLAYLDSTKQ